MPVDPTKLIAETAIDIAENVNRQYNATDSAQDEKVKKLIEAEIDNGPRKTKRDYYKLKALGKTAAEFIEKHGGDSTSYKDWTDLIK